MKLWYCLCNSQAQVVSKASAHRIAESGHNKLCVCSRFSALLNHVSITHLCICLLVHTTFVMHFN